MIIRWALLLLSCWTLSATAGEVSVLDFGAVPDDNQDDTAAFQAAVRDGGIVRVPAGVYQVTVSGKAGGFAVDCPRSVRLVGEGRDRSKITTEAKLTATGNLFGFQPNTRVTVRGLTVQGPTELSGYYSVPLTHYGGKDGLLRIEDCDVAGGHIGIKVQELDGKQESPRLVVLDSLIRSPMGIIQVNSGYLDVVRTEFRDYGVPGSNQSHAIYVSRPVHTLVDRGLFRGNLGDGFDIHVWSPDTPGRGSLTVQNSEFGGKGQGILDHPETLSVIRGCRLGETVVWVQRGGAVVSESTLKDRGQVRPWPWNPPGAGGWTLRDNRYGD